MPIFIQTVAGCAGIAISAPFLVPHHAPGIVYGVIAGLCAWGATWLYARWKFGRGISVRPSLRVD
jgi:hypothetical protein